ncbi:MAG: ECF transporter S component [Synergistaceae bacterium]|jgi:uncharacterized membrane protein|nr:ECF transporter S component [Synergistaceae bacterium]
MGAVEGTSSKIRKFAATSLFTAIIFLMTFTPIGFINLGFINATIMHVPVIIGSILLGPSAGACLGAMFGLASLIRNTVMPNILSFTFSPFIPVPGTEHGSLLALVICFIPRILVGVTPWYILKWLYSLRKGDSNAQWRLASLFAAGIAGSMTNTLLVMHLMFLMFRGAYASARGIPVNEAYGLVLSVITVNGIPEAILAGVLASAVCVKITSLPDA